MYQKHTSDFVNQNTKNATTLSTYIWKLKQENVVYEATCNLCVSDKIEIIFNPQNTSLNSRN